MAGEQPIASAGVGWVASVTIDAADPEGLARFWAELLGLAVRPREGRFVALQRPPAGAPGTGLPAGARAQAGEGPHPSGRERAGSGGQLPVDGAGPARGRQRGFTPAGWPTPRRSEPV